MGDPGSRMESCQALVKKVKNDAQADRQRPKERYQNTVQNMATAKLPPNGFEMFKDNANLPI